MNAGNRTTRVRIASILLGTLLLGSGGWALTTFFLNKKESLVVKISDEVPAVAERVSNSISEEEQAGRNMRFKKSNAALNQARRQLESLKNPRAEDIATALAEVKLAESSLNVAQADLDQSVIRSPIIGQVLQVHVRQGQKIGDKGVVDIGDTRIMHAIAEVFEEDIGRVALGQKAEVFVPSLRSTLKGKVERISRIVARKSVFSNDPVEDTDARVIEVRIALDTEDSQRVSGLSNARIHARIDAPDLAQPMRTSTSKSTMQTDHMPSRTTP